MKPNLPEPMLQAFLAAQKAADSGEVPVGAVVVDKLGNILAVASNRTLADRDPTAHAEMLAIREAAAKLGSERLIDCDLYVTLEPCAMCAAAISFARIRRLYFGAGGRKNGRGRKRPGVFQSSHLPPQAGNLQRHRRAASKNDVKEFFQG